MKKHIVSSYDWELKRLNSTVTDMGYLAMEQIEASINAMRKRDSKKAKQIVLDDQKIDNLEYEVANLSLRLLALRQPMALDLRNIVASLNIYSDIERIADYASNIAERSPLLSSSKPIQLLTPSIIELGNLVSKMFKNIVEAYAKQDSLKAMQIWKSDVSINVENDNAEKLFKLLNLLEENEDVQSVSSNFEVSDDIMNELTV